VPLLTGLCLIVWHLGRTPDATSHGRSTVGSLSPTGRVTDAVDELADAGVLDLEHAQRPNILSTTTARWRDSLVAVILRCLPSARTASR
jgi:hypothetical protein